MPKIKGKDHLIKDEFSQAVINTDRDAYTLYKKTMQQIYTPGTGQIGTDYHDYHRQLKMNFTVYLSDLLIFLLAL